MTAPTDDTTGTLTRTEAETSTELAARPAPAADASLEALGRIVRAAWVEVAKKEAKTVPGYVDLWKWLEIPDADTDRKIGEQVVRAVDASRPAPPTPEEDDEEPLTRGARVRTVTHLTALFSPSLHPHRRPNADGKIVRRMTSGDIYYDVRHDDGTVAGYERSELIDLTADASRPGLTEEQATDLRERAALIAETCSGGDHTITNRDLIAQRIRALPLRAARGEVGPAATGLTRAMHAAQQRPSVPARIEYEHGPDGETYRVEDDWQPCACGAAVSRGEAHSTGPGHDVDWSAVDRQRATLHAGDPAAPDPRVDYSDGMRPAVTGGECAKCLHAPPLHERTCPTLARRPR